MRLTEHGNFVRQRLVARFGEKFYRWFLRNYGHKNVNEFSMLSHDLGMWREEYFHYEFVLRKLRQIEIDQA